MQAAVYQNGSFAASFGITPNYRRNLKSLNDMELVDLCKQGDQKAMDTLVNRYIKPMERLAYRLTRNQDAAQEVLAEALTRMFRNVGDLRNSITLTAWTNRIVVSAFLDIRRRAQRRPASSLDAMVECKGDSVLCQATNSPDSPHQILEDEERSTIIHKAISMLPDHQGKIITLSHFEERSYEEIAEILRLPVGTVKSRLNRARLALRAILKPHLSVLS